MIRLLVLLTALQLPSQLFPRLAQTTPPPAPTQQTLPQPAPHPSALQQLLPTATTQPAASNPQDSTVVAQQYANDILTWVGFGTIVGLAAKAIMPGRDPGGAVATLAMGIGGTMIGCGVLMYFKNGERISPISPAGFAVATAGAFVLLFFYRLLGGRYFYEGDGGLRNTYQPVRRSRRRVDLSQYYD
jgi:uncharacterized membrane protein YeaQ/YmgE (transglycosylase-associated protein family)